jgi:catechol 2,3-dioxygenase-like lactoylglutathione lyase family enzyme
VTPQSEAPRLGQVNLVVQDVARSIAFYRLLGLSMEAAADPAWARHHATALMPNGMRLELDSVAFARQWNPAGSGEPGSSLGVLFFSVDSPEDVDRRFTRLTSAGHAAQQPPTDAFWGARYAILTDPDGHAIGLMSPIDSARRRPPPAAPG